MIKFISIYAQVIGIPSALLRLSEPFVYHNLIATFKRMIDKFRGINEPDKRANVKKRMKK